MGYALGKKPAREGAIKFALRDYIAHEELPPPPAEFGYEAAVPAWGMLGNDRWGDCVLAGAAHETMLWNSLGGRSVAFSDASVSGDYSAITGFDPVVPSTDQGTDMQAAASYRLKTGVADAAGARHTIGAYVSLEKGNLFEHKFAAWVFGAVGVGLTVSDAQMDQFDAGLPWDGLVTTNQGGHYVPIVGFREGYFLVVTWGRVQRMSQAFFAANNDESVAYLSKEMMRRGAGPSGLYLWRLGQDLEKVKGARA